MHVTLRSYAFLTGILFALIGLAHAVKLYYGWVITIDGAVLPDWTSWVFIIVCVLIAWEAVKLSKGK
ncbi:MAG: hypothetical protein A2542_03020 [Parcubacteria group bacterium RIFOXYD2_FULL_52_8]|nr:MAG: hypothetical protein A2542_03020 [Parcubacteria group bacterium RIFOXYD2_FULL_52_8]